MEYTAKYDPETGRIEWVREGVSHADYTVLVSEEVANEPGLYVWNGYEVVKRKQAEIDKTLTDRAHPAALKENKERRISDIERKLVDIENRLTAIERQTSPV